MSAQHSLCLLICTYIRAARTDDIRKHASSYRTDDIKKRVSSYRTDDVKKRVSSCMTDDDLNCCCAERRWSCWRRRRRPRHRLTAPLAP